MKIAISSENSQVDRIGGEPTMKTIPKQSTALIVEDCTATYAVLEHMFSRMNIQTLLAADPVEARYLFRKYNPRVLILDLNLGKPTTGLDIYENLVQFGHRCYTVVYAARITHDDLIHGRRLGVNRFIVKRPNFLRKIANAAKKAIDKDAFTRPVPTRFHTYCYMQSQSASARTAPGTNLQDTEEIQF
jgi:DNA-binding NtrC family response regulator